MGDATPDQLRELLARCQLSQREAARRLEITERDFRRMCAGTLEVPNVVVLALQHLAQETPR
jgi:hypothetical protein